MLLANNCHSLSSGISWFQEFLTWATNQPKSLEIHSRGFLVYSTQGEANEKGVGKTSVCPSGVTEVCRGLEGGSPIERIRPQRSAGRSTPLGLHVYY